jgi:hypothetical protein
MSIAVTLILVGLLTVRELVNAYRGVEAPPPYWFRPLDIGILAFLGLFVIVIGWEIYSVLQVNY